MSEDIIYNQIPKLPSTLSNPDTCKICGSSLNERITKVYLYDVFNEKSIIADIKMLYCEECNMPYCTRHHEAYVKQKWSDLHLQAIPVVLKRPEKVRERCQGILFGQPKSYSDAPLIDFGTRVYVGISNHYCSGKKQKKLKQEYYKVRNADGNLGLRQLYFCKACGKVFVDNESYEKDRDSYDARYVFSLKDSSNKRDTSKTVTLKLNSKIYVGTHKLFPSTCPAKAEDIIPVNVVMENIEGNKETHLLSQCKKCGKIFMKTHIYSSWANYYQKYTYVLSEKRENYSKNLIVANHKELEKRSVEPKDFLIRVNVFQCTSRNHKLIDIIATVKVLSTVGVLKEVSIPAAYCKTCDKYYILETDYRELKKYGTIVCKVVENTYWTKYSNRNPYNLNQESVLHLLGYEVNSQSKLTQSQRWGLLEIILDEKILSRMEICSHIDYLINRSKNRKNYSDAISRWKTDREHISNYIEGSRNVTVVSITANIKQNNM